MARQTDDAKGNYEEFGSLLVVVKAIIGGIED